MEIIYQSRLDAIMIPQDSDIVIHDPDSVTHNLDHGVKYIFTSAASVYHITYLLQS